VHFCLLLSFGFQHRVFCYFTVLTLSIFIILTAERVRNSQQQVPLQSSPYWKPAASEKIVTEKYMGKLFYYRPSFCYYFLLNSLWCWFMLWYFKTSHASAKVTIPRYGSVVLCSSCCTCFCHMSCNAGLFICCLWSDRSYFAFSSLKKESEKWTPL